MCVCVYTQPRAGGFDDENLRLLQKVGLVDDFIQTSNNMRMGLDDGEAVNMGSRNGHGYGYRGFYQPRFEDILRKGIERFSNVSIKYSTCCLEIRQFNDYAETKLQDDLGKWVKTPGDEAIFESHLRGPTYKVRSKFVIGCDGAHSVVRKAMGSKFVDLGFTERWWACDMKLHNEADLWDKKIPNPRSRNDLDRTWGLIPLWKMTDKGEEGRHIRFEFKVIPKDEQTYGGDLQSPERIKNLISNWLDPEDYLLVRFAMYHFRGLIAEKWNVGRLFLAGDACHTMPPYMGQGLNQGFKDIANLPWKISAVLRDTIPDPHHFLRTYQEEREKNSHRCYPSFNYDW